MAGLGGGYNPGGGGNRGVNYHARPVQQMSIDGRPLILNRQGNALVANPAQPHLMSPYQVGSRTYPDWHPLAVARRDFEPNLYQETPPPSPWWCQYVSFRQLRGKHAWEPHVRSIHAEGLGTCKGSLRGPNGRDQERAATKTGTPTPHGPLHSGVLPQLQRQDGFGHRHDT